MSDINTIKQQIKDIEKELQRKQYELAELTSIGWVVVQRKSDMGDLAIYPVSEEMPVLVVGKWLRVSASICRNGEIQAELQEDWDNEYFWSQVLQLGKWHCLEEGHFRVFYCAKKEHATRCVAGLS